jgi:hypothetical protein
MGVMKALTVSHKLIKLGVLGIIKVVENSFQMLSRRLSTG